MNHFCFRFVYLQLFLTPHSSSFIIENKTDNSEETQEDFKVVPEVISLLMAVIYSTFPGMLHVILHIVNNPLRQVLSFTVLVSEIYIKLANHGSTVCVQNSETFRLFKMVLIL